MLTPLAVDPAHPFPYISGLSLNLAVLVRNPRTGKEHFARVKVPPTLRPVRARSATQRFVPLEDVIARAPQAALPRHGGARGRTPSGSPATRTSRSRRTTPRTCSRPSRRSCCAAGSARRSGSRSRSRSTRTCSSCWSPSSASPQTRSSGSPARSTCPACTPSPTWPREDLQYPAFVPTTHRHLAEVESAAPVDVFSGPARATCCCTTRTTRSPPPCSGSSSRPPPTRTCSRSSRRSTAPPATPRSSTPSIDAAEAGKQVLVLVEIKARFDEQANIRWARKLEQAGCHVVYGLVGLKTHCKLSLVVRDEPDGIRRYTHIGTGNYNPKTARLYEDLGLLTTDEAIGEDLTHLFNHLSGYSRNASYDQLLVAPDSRAQRADRPRIHREIAPPPGRPPGRDPDQGQLDRRRGASSTRSTAPRQAGVPVAAAGPRHLRAAPRRTRPVREHPGALDPRPLPRAHPGLLVRQRRRARGVDRLRRPDAPQPRPPGRGAGAAARRRRRGGGQRTCSTSRSTTRPRRGSSTPTAPGAGTRGRRTSRRP